MNRTARALSFLVVSWLTACQPPAEPVSVEPQEIRVVTSGGFTAAYNILAPQFEARTGIRLITEYGASSGGAPDSIPERLARGELFDLVILSRSSLDRLTERGDVTPESRRDQGWALGLSIGSASAATDVRPRPSRERPV